MSAEQKTGVPAAADGSAPRTVAIIMDGNGRWAAGRGVPVAEGHREGTRALRRSVEAAIALRITTLAVYAFSTENWSRPPDEVAALMEILGETIDKELPDLARQGVRTRFLGRRDRVPDELRRRMEELEQATSALDTLCLWIAFDYGGRAELVEAARRCVADGLTPEEVDEAALAARLYAPELPEIDLLIRTSGEFRISNFMLWETAYAELVFTDTLWPDFGLEDLAGGARAVRRPRSAVRRPVSAFWSRIAVALVLLPVVLGIVWLGGWWLFAIALVGGLMALHELYVMGRGLRPLVLGGYVGLGLTLVGAEVGDISWMVGGIFATVLVAFVVFGFSDARPSATAAISLTLLGVVWVGGGLASLVLLRDIPENGRLAVFTVLIAVFADDTAAYFVGRTIGRHKMAPTISPGKSWEGFVGGTLAAMAVAFFAMYDQGFLTDVEAVVLGGAIAISSTLGDLFESAIKRDLGMKDSGRILAGHGGVLDRVDSILWAGPAAFYVVLALT